MQISYLSIRNFRGIKKLDSYFDSKFICLIGSGDSCKTTVLTAIEYALTQRWNINFDDSDFYDQDVSEPITISITLTDWNNEVDEVKSFFQESKFGQFIGGLTENGPIDEPEEGCKPCITLQLHISNTLEPIWQVVKAAEVKQVLSTDRAIFALGRIDSHLDNNFTWGRNTSLTKLSTGNGENLNVILSNIARLTKNNKISLEGYNTIAKSIQIEAIKMGVKLKSITPKIDIQKVSLATGALSLHEAEIPLRNFGAGSKKLISCAIHAQLNKGRNITLIDELETGLEPHRIRGLIKNLKASNQQIITTMHSPVVLRELTVKENELFVCRKDDQGNVSIHSVNDIPDLQACIRSNAEAFLGRNIIVCEGATEIGCLRALDQLKSNTSIPVWTLSTAYYNAGGIGNVRVTAIKLKKLGYTVSVFCDNDTPDQFTTTDTSELKGLGIEVINWEDGNSIETQLFKDIQWSKVPGLFNILAEIKETDLESLIKSVTDKISNLTANINEWVDKDNIRNHLAYVVSGKNIDGSKCKNCSAWFKRIDLAEDVFNYCIPFLTIQSVMHKKLNALWSTVQNEQ